MAQGLCVIRCRQAAAAPGKDLVRSVDALAGFASGYHPFAAKDSERLRQKGLHHLKIEHGAFTEVSPIWNYIIPMTEIKIPEIGFPPSEKDLSEGLFLDPLLFWPLSDTIGSPLHLIACEGP